MHKRIFLAASVAAAVVVCPAHATLTSTTNTVSYTGNGVTTAFTVPFKFLASPDLVVTVAGVTKSLGADYAVSGAGNSTGTVTFTTAPANAASVVITRTVPYTQTTSPSSSNRTYDRAIENALDRVTMQAQQLQNLYTNPPASVLPANTTAKLNNIRMADQFATIQAAITDAGATGAVLIPSSYVGVDTYTNPNGIPIVDLRSGGGGWRGATFAKDFGAICDGSADDTAKIQLAVTIGAGGPVVLPLGTCRLTDTINVSVANTRILGGGGKIKMALPSNHATGRLFYVTASNVEFNGVWIDSTGTSATTSTNMYPIRVVGTSGSHLTNIRILNSQFTNLPWADVPGVLSTHANYIQWVDGFTARNNKYDAPSGAAIFLSGVTDAKVLDNSINNTGWYSIQLNDAVDGAIIRGNRITGTTSGIRNWGGSVNLMSNSTTGTACGSPGCARNKHVDIVDNYISGVHSYTAAVQIESSSYVTFKHNIMELISLTDGTPPDYVRVYVRPVGSPGNEGPNDHIDVSDNLMTANGVSNIAVYVDAQSNGAALAYSDTLTVRGNHVASISASHYFAKCIILHGQDGGWKNVAIAGNLCTGFPDSSSPVTGLLGMTGLVGAPVLDGQVINNTLELVGGAATTSTHLGLSVDSYAQRVQVSGNSIKGFWHGLRTFANASAWFGAGNVFSGSVNADIVLGVAPTVMVGGTIPTYAAPLLLTGRTSNLAATTVVSLAAAGEYRVCATARTTTSGSGTTATLNIIWTDEGGAKTDAVGTWALNAVDVTGQINKCEFIHTAASTNIQVSTSGGTYGTSQYAISATAEKLN